LRICFIDLKLSCWSHLVRLATSLSLASLSLGALAIGTELATDRDRHVEGERERERAGRSTLAGKLRVRANRIESPTGR